MFIVTGTLKGYDQLLNLVLDEAIEYLRGMKFTADYVKFWSCCDVFSDSTSPCLSWTYKINCIFYASSAFW